jgi:hypothetical protein
LIGVNCERVVAVPALPVIEAPPSGPPVGARPDAGGVEQLPGRCDQLDRTERVDGEAESPAAALSWTFGPPNGPPAARGIDIAAFANGRITSLTTLLVA